MKNEEILELRIKEDEPETVREYLVSLLEALWEEGEGFSGKRPGRNSGWEYDLFAPLVRVGLVTGKLDEYGSVEECNERKARKVIANVIRSLRTAGGWK